MVIGLARVLTPGDKIIFGSPPTNTAEFKVQNRRVKEAKVLHLLFVTSVYFSK